MMLLEGQRFLDEGRFEEALACFQGDDPRAIFGRGVALQLLARFEEAEAEYLKVLARSPRNEETLANLIALSVERFDLASVERYSRQLLDIAPGAPIALEGLIVVGVERGDYDLAASCFARLKPVEEESRDAVEYRLSRQMVERLKERHRWKEEHGPVAHPY
jgi:tetratricopeptide (TPR) repeat protein